MININFREFKDSVFKIWLFGYAPWGLIFFLGELSLNAVIGFLLVEISGAVASAMVVYFSFLINRKERIRQDKRGGG